MARPPGSLPPALTCTWPTRLRQAAPTRGPRGQQFSPAQRGLRLPFLRADPRPPPRVTQQGPQGGLAPRRGGTRALSGKSHHLGPGTGDSSATEQAMHRPRLLRGEGRGQGLGGQQGRNPDACPLLDLLLWRAKGGQAGAPLQPSGGPLQLADGSCAPNSAAVQTQWPSDHPGTGLLWDSGNLEPGARLPAGGPPTPSSPVRPSSRSRHQKSSSRSARGRAPHLAGLQLLQGEPAPGCRRGEGGQSLRLRPPAGWPDARRTGPLWEHPVPWYKYSHLLRGLGTSSYPFPSAHLPPHPRCQSVLAPLGPRPQTPPRPATAASPASRPQVLCLLGGRWCGGRVGGRSSRVSRCDSTRPRLCRAAPWDGQTPGAQLVCRVMTRQNRPTPPWRSWRSEPVPRAPVLGNPRGACSSPAPRLGAQGTREAPGQTTGIAPEAGAGPCPGAAEGPTGAPPHPVLLQTCPQAWDLAPPLAAHGGLGQDCGGAGPLCSGPRAQGQPADQTRWWPPGGWSPEVTQGHFEGNVLENRHISRAHRAGVA